MSTIRILADLIVFKDTQLNIPQLHFSFIPILKRPPGTTMTRLMLNAKMKAIRIMRTEARKKRTRREIKMRRSSPREENPG